MRIADLVRDFIQSGSAPTYTKAAMWNDDQYPFNNPGDSIILARQNGRAVDAYVREIDVDVMMFSKVNSDGADLSALYDDAEAALEYVKANFVVNDDLKLTITQDVTGPYQTGSNRYYYRFNLLTYSE